MKELFAKYDCTVDRTDDRGKHWKYYLQTPSGPKVLTCSRTASDNRAMKNTESILKRWSRA